MTGTQALINNMWEPITEGGTGTVAHQHSGTPAHRRISAMDQYYEIGNINIIVQICVWRCANGTSSVEYLYCIFVTNIYDVYFG